MTTTAPEQTRPALAHRQILLLMGGLMTGMLLAALDQTIVGTALPTIVGELGGLEHYSWVVTAYLLASTASTPLYGKISDLYGRRPVLLFAISTFLVGSLLAGLSQDMTQLIVTRAVQGVGAGGLMTLAFTVVSDVLPPRDRPRYQGLFGAVFGISSVAGPLVGGYFAENDWRWIFYINVPLAVFALYVCSRVLRLVPHQRRDHRIDYLGAALMVAAVSAVLLALSWGGNEYAWGSPTIVGLLVVGAVLTVLFLVVESRAEEPILPPRLFKRATFTLANTATFVLGFAMFGSIIYVPLYLQIVRGATPTSSGLLMLPMMGGVIVTSIVAGRLISRLGRYKWFTVAGTLIMGAGLLLFTTLQVDTPLWQAFIYMTTIGVGLGLAIQPLVLAVQNALDLRDMGAGTSAVTFFRSLGGSVGVAALGAVMTNRLTEQMRGNGMAGVSINAPAEIRKLPAQMLAAVEHIFVNALHPVFLSAAIVALVGTLLTVALPNKPLQGAAPDTPAQTPTAEEMESKVAAF
ncbi:MFS transporter [Dactylosporangium roseum]|uniref:MFS transporter n=1 Tax=Dactylosporangium roseum TaxID=47989 RepID=A0ABY5Z5W9_9ACTN|nr:MDR family MFS transporter [Dactylosporangium roseum]UWZ37247.1 MFS transporter [Dactylosporangium roseum]